MAFALGDILYRAATGWKRLPGNTTTTPKALMQTGTGVASAAPAWVTPAAPGTGTVTNTGTLTDHALVVGNGWVDVSALGSLGTSTQVLHGNAAGDPTFGAVALGADVSGDLPFANLAQIAGLSVLGVAGSATADVAAVTATVDGQVLTRVSSSSLAFQAPAASGITQLTGDGTAGPGSGSQALTLANTAVTPGSYVLIM